MNYRARGSHSTNSVAPAVASPSASPAAPGPVTRMSDLPPPRTNVPAAASEYASGIQAMHDNSWFTAFVHFTKAGELDPSMAEAHFRASMVSIFLRDPPTRRALFEKAAGLVAQLGERDRALMEAMQPYLQAQIQDVVETEKRLRALTQRYPNDVEIWMWLGGIHWFTPEGLAPAEHALELDPRDVVSWELKGDSLVVLGKAEEAHAAYERCGAFSIDGAECFAWMSFAD